MHYPCLDKAIPGHETLQTMEVNIMERKHQGNTKKAAQATSKQDGQFMAINAAQAEQDMDQEKMFLTKLPLPASKKAKQTRSNKHKTCMHYPCLDKTIPGHETLQTMEVDIMQRKYKGNKKKAAQPTSKQDG